MLLKFYGRETSNDQQTESSQLTPTVDTNSQHSFLIAQDYLLRMLKTSKRHHDQNFTLHSLLESEFGQPQKPFQKVLLKTTQIFTIFLESVDKNIYLRKKTQEESTSSDLLMK